MYKRNKTRRKNLELKDISPPLKVETGTQWVGKEYSSVVHFL